MSFAEELRKSVLQAAIEGKLVSQNSSEEPANILLCSIKTEKERLVNDRKIKKEDDLDLIYESEFIFDIPENWKWVRLGEIVDFRIGKTPPRHEFKCWGNDYPWVSIADMISNGKVTKTKEFVSEFSYNNNFNGKISPKGTLIMSFKLTIGKVSILDVDAFHNEAIISIFPYVDKENCLRNYLFRILPFMSTFGDSKNAIKGNTLNSKSLNNLLIPLPPLDEQKRIVEKMDEFMKKIDEFEKIEDELESIKKAFPDDMKKSLLQAAIQGKLTEQLSTDSSVDELLGKIRAQKEQLIKDNKINKEKALAPISDDEIPFDIPENWRWMRLDDVSNINGGYAFKSQNFKNIGVRVIKISDFDEYGFKDNKIVRHDYDESLSQYLIEKENILLCMTGGTVGKSYFVQNIEEKMVTNQRVATIKIDSHILSEYVNYVVLSPHIQKFINGRKNSTNDNISMDDIKSFMIPIPPIEEQKRIIEKLQKLLPHCEGLKQ